MLYLKHIKEYTEYLITEGTVFNDVDISIHMDGSQYSNFIYDPYIKVYDGPYRTAKNVVRIYLKDAGLDYSHNSKFGKLIMTNKIGRRLNDIFKSTYKEKNMTYYDYLWLQIQSRFGNNINYISCPDFTKFYIRKE